MQIWNGCNVLNIVGNPIKDININLSFLSSRWKVVEWTPQDWRMHLTSKIVEWTPSGSDIWWNLEILLFYVQSNNTCKFALNLFPISWGPFQDVNLLYFLLKMQIWNGCNVLNIVGNPIKDININLSFLSSRWKVVEWTPQVWRMHFWVKDQSCCMDPPRIWHLMEFWKFYFSMYSTIVHANLP